MFIFSFSRPIGKKQFLEAFNDTISVAILLVGMLFLS